MNKIIQIAKLGILAAVLIAGGQYAKAQFTTPPSGCIPPACNTATPLNVGTTTQTKLSGLRIESLIVSSSTSIGGGLYVSGIGPDQQVLTRSLTVQNGNVLIGGTQSASTSIKLGVNGALAATDFCNFDGENCIPWESLYENFTNPGGTGLSCPSTPNGSTMYGVTDPSKERIYFNQPGFGQNGYYGASSYRKWDYTKISMPEQCRTDDGCVIRQKTYKRSAVPGWPNWYQDKLSSVRDVSYRQINAGAAQFWTSDYDPKGNKQNGDNTSSNIIKPISYIYLRDDANPSVSTFKEISPTQWSLYDNVNTLGSEIFICTPIGSEPPDPEAV